MAYTPYTQRFAQNQLAQFNRLAAGSPATPTMSRTQMRLPNIVAMPPSMRPAAPTPMFERVARQAAQSRLATPRRPLPPVTGQTPPQQPQEADTGLMGALRAPLMSPRGQAISQAALAGLEAGGYTTMPTTLGQAIGKMGQAALQGYAAGEERLAAQQQANLNKLLTEAKIKEAGKTDLPTLQKNLLAAGLKLGTPEFNKALLNAINKPSTVFMGGDKQKELSFKAALDTRKEMVKSVDEDREMGVRLDQAINLLESGVPTGRLEKATLGLKQLFKSANVLSDEAVDELEAQELISNVTSYLTPRMRVTGSGASSDRDMDFFQKSTVNMANTPAANLVIAKMAKQLMDYNKRRLNLFDDYVKREGSDLGFGKYADSEMGSVYYTISDDEQFTELLDDKKLKIGDVYYNANKDVQEFQYVTKEML